MKCPTAQALVHSFITHSFTSFISIYDTKTTAKRASSSVIYTSYLFLNVWNRRWCMCVFENERQTERDWESKSVMVMDTSTIWICKWGAAGALLIPPLGYFLSGSGSRKKMKLMISSSSTATRALTHTHTHTHTHTLHKYAFTLGSRFGQKKCTVLVLKKGGCVILTHEWRLNSVFLSVIPRLLLSYLHTHTHTMKSAQINASLVIFLSLVSLWKK